MRKFSAYFMLIVFLCCVQPRQSEAFLPVVVPVAYLAGASLLAIGAFAFYRPSTLPSGWHGPAVITSGGNIARVLFGVQPAYTQYGQSSLEGGLVAAKANIAAMQALFAAGANNIQTTYAALYAALFSTPPVNPVNYTSPVGAYVSGDATYPQGYKVTGTAVGATMGGQSSVTWCSSASGSVCNQWTSNHNIDAGHYTQTRLTVVLGSPTPSARSAADMAMAYPTFDLPPSASADLDAMIAANANGYGISIMDAVDSGHVDQAPPFIAPAPSTSPVSTTLPNVTNLGTATAAATAAAAAAAAANAASTASAATAAHNALLADPTNPTLIAADKAAAAAAAAAATAAGTTATTAVTADAASKEIYQNADVAPLKKLDFSSIKNLSGLMTGVFPFVLISSITANLNTFVASPVPPVFVFPLPLGFEIRIDLSPWDTLATLCRYAMAMMLTGGGVLYVVRFWRGVA